MKKELYQMLEMICKTADSTRIQVVSIRHNLLDDTEMIVEATDTFRAIQITTNSEFADGLYKIAKTGTDYTLLLIPEDRRERFPDVDRVLYKDTSIMFERRMSSVVPDIIIAQIQAYFGSMQETQAPGKQTHGINIIRPKLLDVIKPWCKLSDDFTLKCKTPSYAAQIESESEGLKIKFLAMPFTS